MRIFFKYVVPAFLIVAVILILTQSSIGSLGNLILFLFVPFAVIYVIAVYQKELNNRTRNDGDKSRILVITTSILSHVAVLLLPVSIILHLDGQHIFQLIATISVIVSLGASLFFFVRNFKKIDYYIPSEYFISIAPSLLLIGIFSISTLVPKSIFDELEKNSSLIEKNNQFILDHFQIDSLALVSYQDISGIEEVLIEFSGGFDEFHHLTNGKSKDHFTTFMVRMRYDDELKSSLKKIFPKLT